ncbi:aldo/keto reductase [Paenibacillus larvae]
MSKHLSDAATLNNGVAMPWLGLGVWNVKEGEVYHSVKAAIELGYRSIDTAAIYENEEGVGKAIKDSGVQRDHLFITTKLWNTEQGYESTLKAFDVSMKKLGLDYLDLYLIHWPGKGEKFVDTWKAFEKLYKEGYIRAIGVSNFHVHHLNQLMEAADVVPAVNQVEFHPRFSQVELRNYCKQKGIQLEAWSPLMQGKLLDNPTLKEIGDKYGKSTSQVILRWDLQNEVVTIPKSVNPERIRQNADLFDFELSEEDMERINGLNKDERNGPNPDEFLF